MSWRLARSLETLRAEINAGAPRRSKASDGTIGDDDHAARASDHNPNDRGVVRAFDITHDPDNGVDCNELAAALIPGLGLHPALGSGAYLIWQARIISTDKRSAGWRPSTGHHKHLHVSVATAAAGYDSTAPWGVMEDDMAGVDADRLNKAVDRILGVTPEAGDKNPETGEPAQLLDERHGNHIVSQIGALTEVVRSLALGQGLDPATVEDAAERGAAKALENLTLVRKA